MVREFLIISILSAATAASEAQTNCKTIEDATKRLQCFDNIPAVSKEDSLIAKAKAVLRKQLRDQASARFQDLKIMTDGKARAVCGTINAKNAGGGMTGPQLFVYDGTYANVMVLSDGADNPTTFTSDVLAIIFKRARENYDRFCKR